MKRDDFYCGSLLPFRSNTIQNGSPSGGQGKRRSHHEEEETSLRSSAATFAHRFYFEKARREDHGKHEKNATIEVEKKKKKKIGGGRLNKRRSITRKWKADDNASVFLSSSTLCLFLFCPFLRWVCVCKMSEENSPTQQKPKGCD